ncbi:MAG: methionine synthase [Acidothermus sp.]|nr:methionine synthase [Acidothermus sp.]MCL6537994.1 methionine synthase [Acidothermus sp.]
MNNRAELLRHELGRRLLVADGAMGTMLQAARLTPADFTLDDRGYLEGCNEVLNLTRPDVVAAVHEAYLAAGCDAIETNTFGANLGNLGEYGVTDLIGELAEAGARIAREVADRWSTPTEPRFVLGSVGPGTKLPSLGHVEFATLRDAYQRQVGGLIAGGVDAVLVETVQDLLQAKAAIIGAKRARAATGTDVPIFVSVTVETTGTMLLGTEIGAALTALAPLGVDMIGLNCATGPAEMGEHLRHLATHAELAISCMPNAGLPVLEQAGARYPLTPAELVEALDEFASRFGLALVGGCCGTTPDHLRLVAERLGGRGVPRRDPRPEPAVSSLYQAVSLRQETSFLAVGERTNANGSKAFREALLAERYEDCVELARSAARDGSHLVDVCVDYVGREGTRDMRELARRLATATTLPVMLDSTEPAVIEAGLECLGGRCVVNSVNFEDGEGPGSRFARLMPIVKEHGAAVVALTIDETGQARTAEHKVAVARRLIETLTGRWGLRESDILVDCLTFTLGTGQEESRRDGLATIEAIRELKSRHPAVGTILGISNISFGLSPPARVVLNSVFLDECVRAGLDAAIVHSSKILPISRIPAEQREVALDLIYDRRREGYDPLARFLELFAGVSAGETTRSRAAELAALPLEQRLHRRIVDGERNGLETDLDEALKSYRALQVINDILLPAMKEVGDLFGRGAMQLPFVLQSAEVMKAAVAYLEPHMERTGKVGKGTIVLATVKGDVHDIGKNLVDIILSNNGYRVVNLGIKQPIGAILDAAQQHDADAIGMSGLLVKSTVVMRENLQEMMARGLAHKWPVLLGGAALTRAYVEEDLASEFDGVVRYARDAFEGLHLMDTLMAVKRGEPGASLPPLRKRRVAATLSPENDGALGRSDVATDVPVPTPPFFGDRVVKGIPLADYLAYLDEKATFAGRWGLRGSSGGPSYAELVETEGRPRLRKWLDRLQADQLLEPAVVYGYYRCVADGDALVVLDETATEERCRFTFPRQRRGRHLCLADFFRPRESGETDVVAFQLVTIGPKVSEFTAQLFAENAYRDYLEVHGLSVQLAEALAEFWHHRIREELGIAGDDSPDLREVLDHQGYRGSRYSFGYPACPNLEDRTKLVALLRPERIGVHLSEEFQLHPEQSTDAIVVHHPEAKYFSA